MPIIRGGSIRSFVAGIFAGVRGGVSAVGCITYRASFSDGDVVAEWEGFGGGRVAGELR